MNKTALIIHGWPQPIDPEGEYYKHFEKWGYKVFSPWIFSNTFELTVGTANKYVLDSFRNRIPDVIVGISMGGLVAPQIAQLFPKAKLILIATAPKIRSNSKFFNFVVGLAKNKDLSKALEIVKILPEKFLYKFYEVVNPFRGSAKERPAYMKDMKQNFKYILEIPISKEREIVEFATSIDNTEMLKTLKNKTLIFSGENDLLMPQGEGAKLVDLISDSRLVVSKGSHFDVIAEPSFVEMKKFLLE